MSTDPGTVVGPPTVEEAPGAAPPGSPPALPSPPDDDLADTLPGERSRQPPRPILAGRYRLSRRIGKGGMGEVIGARDEQVGREVAIKRMRSTSPNARAVRRFLREASIQGRLEHPAIPPVHEIGRDADGLPFFVMKKLTGITLAKVIADPAHAARFGLQAVLRAFAEVCLAVELAHVRGIIHRDLKPDNILLGDFGEVYVLDWGVAKVIGEDDDGEFSDVVSGSGEHATAVGTTIGTPGYMAPEQACGMPDIDGRTDVYTLGLVLFEILAGAPLHPRGPEGMRSALMGADARPSQRAPGRAIPLELDALCVAATATEREQRIQTARELGTRVQRFLDGDRDLARRRDLARVHLANAQAAFDAGDNEELRRTAMREAAAAIALDPALHGAAELVGRLMLEPPRTTPREVEVAISVDEVNTARDNARAGIWALFACFVFTPLLWWIAPPASLSVAVFTVVLLFSAGLYFYAYHGGTPKPALVIIGNTVMIATVGRMFTPILVAPGVAAVLAMAMVLTPRLSVLGSAVRIGVLFIAAALTPMILERLDVISRTISIDDHGILLRAPAIGSAEGPALLVAILYMIGLTVGTCWMAHAMRERARIAHHHLHLQAWQLRQLVPH